MPHRESRAERAERMQQEMRIAAALMHSGSRQERELMSKPIDQITKRDLRRARKMIRDRRK